MTLIPVQWRQRQADCWVLGLWGKSRMAKGTQRNLILKKKKRETLWYFHACMWYVSPFMYVMCISFMYSMYVPFMYVMCVPLHVCPLHVCYMCSPSCMSCVSPFMYVMCVPLYVCHMCPLAVSSGLLSLCRFCFYFLSQGLSITSWLSWSLLCRSDWP